MMDQKEKELEKKRREAYKKIIKAYEKLTEGKDEEWTKKGYLNIKRIAFKCYRKPTRELREFITSATIGFNVRLTEDDFIIPLLGGENWEKIMSEYKDEKKKDSSKKHPVKEIIHQIGKEYSIPELFKKIEGQEISFILKKNANGFFIKNLKVDGKKYQNTDLEQKLLHVETETDGKSSFAIVQRNSIYPKSEEVYFWISREMKTRESYLSNILVLSTREESIEFARQNHVKLLRFLFNMETAYAIVLEEERKREAIKSAKSAIMSRNMSHNLGSHVMFYIKQKLESVEKIMQTGALKDLIKSHSITDLKERIKNSTADPGEEMPFLVGLGRFINYLQERQDFIATVATNYIPYRTCISFKDAIFDELKPEKHAQRHNGDATGKKAANLLLDYIAYSEGFKSSEDIELRFGDNFNGGNTPEDVPSNLRKFFVALPGGNLGRQAFFSIMENIIRNTAKHDGSKACNGKLIFQFDILNDPDIMDKNESEDLIIKDIFGYTLRCDEKIEATSESIIQSYQRYDNDFFYLGITIKLCEDVSDVTLKRLSDGLHREYITSDGQMDEECKGLKEIRISSAWLRGHELDDEIPSEEPPAVSIRKTTKGHLQYIICLPKSKKIACIIGGEIQKPSVLGLVDIFHITDYNETLIKKIANYEFIVVDKEIANNKFRLLRKRVGARIFKMDINTINSLDTIYKKWLETAFGFTNKLPLISILDGEGKETSVNTKVKENDKVLESGTAERREQFFKDSIVYIRHYSGQPTYNEESQKIFSEACSIEAVSGGNSTYRLVRQDERDSEWYAKQRAAGLTKVAIFDERLYEMIMPEGDYELASINSIILQFFEKKAIDSNTQNKTWNCFRKEVLVNTLKINEDLALDIYNDELSILPLDKDAESISKDVIKILSQHIQIKDYSRAWRYREAGIWAFNVKIESGIATIMGYSAPVKKNIGMFSDNYREAEIAVIKKEKDGKIEITPLCKPNDLEFDFITVHQGILDKIYTTLEIEKKDKGKVTLALYKTFSKLKKKENDNSFLPQLIIHSGRSKPNTKDMPQKQPFLQFSALDHALRDCKYTLVELLNSAHYE